MTIKNNGIAAAILLLSLCVGTPAQSSEPVKRYDTERYSFRYPASWTLTVDNVQPVVFLSHPNAACRVAAALIPSTGNVHTERHRNLLDMWVRDVVGYVWRETHTSEITGENGGGIETELTAADSALNGWKLYFTTFPVGDSLLMISSCSGHGSAEAGQFVARTVVTPNDTVPLVGTWYTSAEEYLFFENNGELRREVKGATTPGAYSVDAGGLTVRWRNSLLAERWSYKITGKRLIIDEHGQTRTYFRNER